MVSRKEPPRWAVTTIIPALGGASRISFHSSGVKSDFDVIRSLRSLQVPALLAVGTVAPGLAPRAVRGEDCVGCVPAGGFGGPRWGQPLSSTLLPQKSHRRIGEARAAVGRCTGRPASASRLTPKPLEASGNLLVLRWVAHEA